MSGGSTSFGGSSDEATLVQRLLVIVGVVAVGMFLGVQSARGYVLPVAIVVAFGMMFLLFARPMWFLALGLFVFYGAFELVDMERFGRVAGLFRLKDVFLIMMVGYMVTTGILRGEAKRTALRQSKAFRAWAVFMLWILYVYVYTVFYLGEDKMLAFRVGRTYLSYGWPFLLLWWVRDQKDWDRFLRILYVLGFVAIGVALMGSLGLRVSLYAPDLPAGIGTAESLGLYRAGHEGQSLVYSLFMLSFWRFIFKNTRRNAWLAFIFAFGSSLFLFRTRLAGTVFGIVVASLFVGWRYRLRALSTGVIGLLLMVGAMIVFGLFAKTVVRVDDASYLGRVVEFFQRGAEAVAGEGIDAGRRYNIDIRWPLVREHPLIGIGFISPFGSIAWGIYAAGGMPIGVVDVGWIDILVRLGFVGCGLLGTLLLMAARDAVDVLRRFPLSAEEKALCLTLIGYTTLMVVSVYSFSYPTLESSIITFAILFAFIVRIRIVRAPRQAMAIPPKMSAEPVA